MELTIGIRDGVTPITIETEITQEELKAQLLYQLKESGVLELGSSDGSVLLIPARSVGYIRVAKEETRRVGFGFI